jgi:hypothetical protein
MVKDRDSNDKIIKDEYEDIYDDYEEDEFVDDEDDEVFEVEGEDKIRKKHWGDAQFLPYQLFLTYMSESTGYPVDMIDHILKIMPEVIISYLDEGEILRTPLGSFKLKYRVEKRFPKHLHKYGLHKQQPLFWVRFKPGKAMRFEKAGEKLARKRRLEALQHFLKEALRRMSETNY